MIELKNERIAIPVVLFAGLIWSFGPLVVRYMEEPQLVPWQYIFGRGLTIFIILNLYLYFEEGINFYKNYKKVGKSGLVGGIGLGIAMISFIYSITNTTAAITLLCLAAMPFFTALLAFLFLKEKISLNVWISMLIATVGIIIMALGNTEKRDSFAKECIDTLCEALSDHKERLMVIIAGYEKELDECFFNYNQGLEILESLYSKQQEWVKGNTIEEVNNNLKNFLKDEGFELDFELVDFHSSRPGHDLRYALDGTLIRSLGWDHKYSIDDSFEKLILWFLDNPEWLDF